MNNKRKYKNLFARERRFFRRKPAVRQSNNLNTTTVSGWPNPKQNSQLVYKSTMGVIKTKLEIELHNILMCDHRQSLNACTQVPRKCVPQNRGAWAFSLFLLFRESKRMNRKSVTVRAVGIWTILSGSIKEGKLKLYLKSS